MNEQKLYYLPYTNHTPSHLFCAKETTDRGHPQTFFVVPLTGIFKQKPSEYFKLTRNGSHSNRQSFKFQETKMSIKALNLGPLWWWGPIPIYKWWWHYRVCFHLIWALGTSVLERRSEVITQSLTLKCPDTPTPNSIHERMLTPQLPVLSPSSWQNTWVQVPE